MIIEHFRNTNKQFYKSILMLALPVVLQNMITIGVNIMDTVMLGNYGEIQIAGSSVANEFINIFHIFCMGLGGGAAVLTAQYWGKKDIPQLKRAVVIMLRLSFALALICTVATAVAPRFIMSIFTNDAGVIEKGTTYLLISIPTYFLMAISMTLTLILRSVRKVKIPLITSIIAFFVNIFFNWVFIFGKLGAPELQIAGAALGTVISRVVEAAIIGIYFFVTDKDIGLRIRDIFGPTGDMLPRYIKYSLPVVISDALLAFGNSAVAVVIGHISAEFVAANSIIATIVRLSTVFNQGLSQAASITTGNIIGKKDLAGAYGNGVVMTCLSVGVGVLAGGIILALSPWIVGMYNISQVTYDIAMELMYAVALMVVFQALQGVLTKGVLRGGGDTKFLMVMDVLFLWVLSVPLGALCGLVWDCSPFVIYVALKIDWIVKTFACLGRLKSKKWIRQVEAK